MELTIGLRHNNQVLELDVDLDAAAINDAVTAAIAANKPLTITDKEGKTAIVPIDALGFVRCVPEQERRVGFGF
ncbi:MAG: DUF3107 domain-containing protein [Trueperella sp.]|nr:DUF3107 domain-containing protein [Trueperella sp.]